ncbi:MAG: hypothetical protein IKV30_01445 [Clostridia bacterium]|nr:hypothetical protein [Clostridia bacterium]
MDDRKLHTVDFVEQTMGMLAWLLAGIQLMFVVLMIIKSPHLINWQWIVQRICLLAAPIFYGMFFATSNKDFRPILLAYGVCVLALAFIPEIVYSFGGFTRVFGEPNFSSYSLFEFLYYCKNCLIAVFVAAVGFFMIRSQGLVNGRIENCTLLMVVVSFIGQMYTILYLLSNNVVLTQYYNCHIGYVAICVLIPAVYVLYCCDESFGGTPTLS